MAAPSATQNVVQEVLTGVSDDSEAQQKPVLKPAENVDLSDVVVAPTQTPAVPAAEDSERAAELNSAERAEQVPSAASATAFETNISSSRVATDDRAVTSLGESGLVSDKAPESDRQETLVLLQTEVPPGTTTRLAWSPKVSFMGVSAPTPVLVVNGVNPGPTMCLTAAVHGDETNGIETVRRVLYSIDAQKLSGAIIGVPIVNLEGFRAGSRYLPDRRDLNRFFPGNQTGSAASRIAFSFFKEVISQCDLLIDLHTGSFGRTNLHQLRADLNAPGVQDLTEQMGRIVVVQSKGARGTLRRAAAERGIPAVTLEAGAPNELDNAVVEDSVKSVKNAMIGLGLINTRKWRRRLDAPVYYKSAWVRASEGGFLISETELGESVRPDQLLGVVTNPITNQRSEIRSPSSGRIIGMALNRVMQPGYAAYHLGIKPVVATDATPDDALEIGALATSKSKADEDPDNAAGSSLTDVDALGSLDAIANDDDAELGR